jgi:hypothetical protein
MSYFLAGNWIVFGYNLERLRGSLPILPLYYYVVGGAIVVSMGWK